MSASRALFEGSGVVVLAAEGDRAGMLLGASAAVALGVPLLIGADGDGVAEPVLAELDRLGTTTVLAVGDAAPAPGSGSGSPSSSPSGEDLRVIGVAADPGALAEVLGRDLAETEPVAEDADVAAVAALDPAEPAALRPEDGGAAQEDGEGIADGELPGVEGGEPLESTLVLATGDPDGLAGVATARAAGARVLVTDGATDPRASEELISALAEDDAEHVVALGAAFGEEAGLDWKLETAATGTQLPGGGQVLFPGKMLVALYGHPGTGALGVMGEQPLEAAIERARAHAAPTSRSSTPPSCRRSRSSPPSRRRPRDRTATTRPRPTRSSCGRGSRRPGRRGCTWCSTSSRAGRTSSPRPSSTAPCWSCRTSGSPWTPNGGWGRTRCT
ncbi:hypothetical protein [Blastococcus brunescens]|uniref:Uncharacterized protein n=1 Tax=Blastococcus brunescens TaxID=1564165 RepID=A0ABZ1B7J7_9ACTN|nr:hypothetical protein [Blastococcus sp. BMG 8361]WRL65359.1 hypothetical protein U6N30_06915 [Blastococcus sp. BMG 8361]